MASGALGMHPAAFLSWLVAFRLVRFGLEAGLASRYGTRVILRFMRTPTFKAIVGALIVMAVVGTVVSTIALVRSSRRRSG